MAFAFVLALLAGAISGTAPAWWATHTDPAQALRGSGRSAGSHSSLTSKSLLIVQATLSVVLVAGAAMLVRSLHQLEYQELGYPAQGRVLVQVTPPPPSYTLAKLTALSRQMEERLSRLPGIQGVGLAGYNPFSGQMSDLIVVAGHPMPDLGKLDQAALMEKVASWDRISPGYLQNLGVPVLRGRGLTPADNETSEPVAVVNEAFVQHFFKKGEDPLDRHFGFSLPEDAGTFRIVGVVRDTKFVTESLRGPIPSMLFAPLAQSVDYKLDAQKQVELMSHSVSGIMLATDVPPATLEPWLRKALAEIDPSVTVVGLRSMREHLDFLFDHDRAVATLASLFGAVALLLAAVGLYAVTAYTVARRTSEIGVRMALGSGRAQVAQLVLGGAFRRVLVGLMLGLPLAVAGGRLISTSLYGVRSWDPLALVVAAGTLGLAALLAVIVPACRAAAIEPMDALRTE